MREKITEAEINALLRGLADVQRDQDPQDPQQQTEELRSPGEPLPFFIPAKEHLHQGPWPGLQVINEQFARLAPEALIGLLPQVSNMIALPLRQLPFSAVLKDLPEPSHCHLVSIDPLAGWGLIAFDARMTLAAASKRFAGTGEPLAADAIDNMSPSELARCGLLLELILSEYNKAWHDFYPLKMMEERMVSQARLAHLAPAQERVVASSFELSVADFTTRIDICLPHASLLPLRPFLRATTHGHRPKPDLHWRQHLTQELQSIELVLSAKLARFDVTVAKLLSLQAGDVLPFKPQTLLEATVDGVPLFACEYGTQNGHYALRVEESIPVVAAELAQPTSRSHDH
jgi:flagellar motor switch protein FliM